MVLLQDIFIVHLQLAASFLGTCALHFITEQNKTTEAFVGTNQTFSWNLSLESRETSKELTFTFGLWDAEHYTVTYFLATVIRDPSGNETVTRTKDQSVESRLYWAGNLRHDAFVAFRLINIQHSDEGQYGVIIRVDGSPPDDYQKSFRLLVKDPPPMVTKAPEARNATVEIIEGETLNITCQGRAEQNSLVVWYRDRHQIQSSKDDTLYIRNVSRSKAGSYTCIIQAPTRNYTSQITTVNVLYAPAILLPTKQVTVELFKGNSTTLKCYASSNPPPTFTWHRGNLEVTEGYTSTANSSVLQVTVHDDNDFTRYHCTAQNRVGWNAVIFVLSDAGAPSVSTIRTQHPPFSSTLEPPITEPKGLYYTGHEGQRLTMYLSVTAVLAVFVIGVFLLHRYLIKRCLRQDCDVGENNNVSLEMFTLDLSHDGARFAAVNQALSEDLEVPRENLNIEKVVGCGAFGVVSRAFALNLPDKPGWTLVAVKSLLDDASEKEKRDLLSELCVLKQLDPHPHVIQLYGYVTSEEHPLVLVEYAPHGDLLGYLRKSRGVHDNYYSDPSVKPHTSITSKGLLKFTWEISDGMAYLSSKKIIHRDLAARNVLVGESEVCKITDFGMAKDVQGEDIYVRTSERRLPIKWTAPEALFGRGSYTTASDVWSFGVVMYEVFTVGCDPFPGASMRDIPELLNNGYRMPRPSFIEQKLYTIMMDCWNDAPAYRPSFQQLRSILRRLLEDEKQEYVNLKEVFYENVLPSSY